METPATSSYDEIPYSDSCFHVTHPDHLATLAAVRGLPVPDLERCRVLELGCARGGNLIPMALELPAATFVGVDLSVKQIEEARDVSRRLGLSNVTFHAGSLTEIDASFGVFDFVVCHGVYSWVPEAVQARILEVCSSNLAPNGLAYVSYNTYPGWHEREIVREVMLYRARRESAPSKRLERARGFLGELARVLPNPSSPYGEVLRNEDVLLRDVSDTYLFHEFLEEVNAPCLVHEFLARAEAHGLELVGEAVAPGLAATLPEATREAVERWSDDVASREQFLDFVCNRSFRRSILRRRGGPAMREPSADVVSGLSVTTVLVPADPATVALDDSPAEFSRPENSGSVTTNNPVGKAALLVLWESRPRSLGFEALWEAVVARLSAGGRSRPASDEESRATLRGSLLRLYLSDLVQLHVRAPRPAAEVCERPVSSPLARLQAERASRVTNLCRRPVNLEEFDRAVLLQLDGTRDLATVVEALVEEVVAGRFDLSRDGEPVRDAELVRSLFSNEAPAAARRLAALGLLAG